jgi:hypothetical protein
MPYAMSCHKKTHNAAWQQIALCGTAMLRTDLTWVI